MTKVGQLFEEERIRSVKEAELDAAANFIRSGYVMPDEQLVNMFKYLSRYDVAKLRQSIAKEAKEMHSVTA